MNSDSDPFENNPDKSIVEIIGKIAKYGEQRDDETKSLPNQIIEVDDLGFDGYPVPRILPKISEVKPEAAIVGGVGLTKEFSWNEYRQKDLVMDDGDCVPEVITHNALLGVIDKLRCGVKENVHCQNSDHVVEFYVRKGINNDNKPKGSRDVLDMTFTAHSAGMTREAGILLMRFSILQKIVALCSGLYPGRLCGFLGVAFVSNGTLDTIDDLNKAYRGIYYKSETPLFRHGMTQILINNKLMDKWRSNIPEIYPNLSDIQEDGSDFAIIK